MQNFQISTLTTDQQLTAIGDVDAYMADNSIPMLIALARTQNVAAWMMEHIFAMCNLDSDMGEVTDAQELVDVLFAKFKYEKPAAFVVFCGKCRVRDYKISYGKIKLEAIVDAATDFLRIYLPPIKERLFSKSNSTQEGKLKYQWENAIHKSIWLVHRDSVLDFYEKEGDKGFFNALHDYGDGHWYDIQALVGIKAVTYSLGRVHYNNEAFEEYLQTMISEGEWDYKPKRELYKSF